MVDDSDNKRIKANFYLGLVVLSVALLVLILVLNIQFSDQSESYIVIQIDWSVYFFLIIAIAYGVISIVVYIYKTFFEGKSEATRIKRAEMYKQDIEKDSIIEQARELYRMGDEHYKINEPIEALKRYEEALQILKENNIKKIPLEKEIRDIIRWVREKEEKKSFS